MYYTKWNTKVMFSLYFTLIQYHASVMTNYVSRLRVYAN